MAIGIRSQWIRISAVVALLVAAILAIPAVHEPILRAAGHALVVADPISPADVVVIALDAGGAGALEAADLVQQGIATQVAVFVDPPSGEDHEFIRRGLLYESMAARQVRQLEMLGVKNILRIPPADAGTQAEGDVLPGWSDEHRFHSIIVVTTTDHARRLRRVVERAMKDHDASITVRPSRYSSFDPDRWWESRRGVRTEIIELQKLLLDIAMHPMTMASARDRDR